MDRKKVCNKMYRATLVFFIVYCMMLGMLHLTYAQSINPKNWSPSWISPAWERPENMTTDGDISVPGDVNLSQYIDPATCKGCHPDIFDQWAGGIHSLALQDPVFQAATKAFLTAANQTNNQGYIEEAKSCTRCHTPVGHLSKTVETTADDYNKFPADDLRSGIFCDFCHSVKSSAGIGNAPFKVEPGEGSNNPGTKRGPHSDSPDTGFHKTEFSELHTRSEMCGMCHDVTHTLNGMPIERTYTEWREGPYNTGDPKTTVHCQDCHMRQKPGVPATGSTDRPDNPGKSCVFGPQRNHIFIHHIAGANAVIPANETTKQLAIERLQNCAELEIIAPQRIQPFKENSFQVVVKNVGAGHYLPTGLSEVRELWLHVTVENSRGVTLFESGAVDKNGAVDPNARMFKIVMVDKDGNHTINVALADHIESDSRIPPKGKVAETYTMVGSLKSLTGATITATLKYRSAPQAVINSLLGTNAPVLPVIDMISATKKIGS
jgi:hypothetical protein